MKTAIENPSHESPLGRSRATAFALTLCLTVFAPSVFADYVTGMAAYKQRDYERAFSELLPAAEAGNPVAQRVVGAMCLRGRGTPKDPQAARRWLERAAKQDDPAAEFDLYNLELNGIGGSQDPEQAREWLRKAQAHGDANGPGGQPTRRRLSGPTAPPGRVSSPPLVPAMRAAAPPATRLADARSVDASLAHAQVDQVQHYLDLRPDLLLIATQSSHVANPDATESAINDMSLRAAAALSHSPQWNPTHPNWNRVQAMVHDTILDVVKEARAHEPTEAQLRMAFVLGYADALTPQEVDQLTRFYSSPIGRAYVAMHEHQLQLLLASMPVLQGNPGQRIHGAALRDDPVLQQAFLMTVDFQMLTLGVAEHGVKDPSGADAIVFAMAAVVESKGEQFDAITRSVSDAQRSQVIAFLRSPLGQKEYDAIRKGGESLAPFVNLPGRAQAMVSAMRKLQTEVQPYLPN